MDDIKIKLGKKEIIIALLVIVSIFILSTMGFTGIRTFVGVGILFFLPMFLILNNLDLDLGEKIIFSLFLGFAVFSTLVYWLGFIVGSLRVSLIIIFMLLVGIGLGLRFFLKKNKR